MTAEQAKAFVMSIFPDAQVRSIYVGRVINEDKPDGFSVQLRRDRPTEWIGLLGNLFDDADSAWIAMVERLSDHTPLVALANAIKGDV